MVGGFPLKIEFQFFVCLGGKIEKVTAVEKLNDKDSKILASVNSYGEVELYVVSESWWRKMRACYEMPVDGYRSV